MIANLGQTWSLFGIPLHFNTMDFEQIWAAVKRTEFFDKFS